MTKYLVTGGAGFIGSNLTRFLLDRGLEIMVLDNFSTGKRENLDDVSDRITIIEGDLRDRDLVFQCVAKTAGIFHLGALGSVPRSVADPAGTHEINVGGTFNVLEAVRKFGNRRIVFSGSSSAYGNQPVSPKTETMAPRPLSPYAAGKICCEAYMRAYAASFKMETVTLRYFNVFGPRQDPTGAYAAVIPAFVDALLNGKNPIVYGDGNQTRDFCYVENVCQANWLAMNAPTEICDGSPFNIACGEQTSLNRILDLLRQILKTDLPAVYQPVRIGDVRDSLADISRAQKLLNYQPKVYFNEGLHRAIDWYVSSLMKIPFQH